MKISKRCILIFSYIFSLISCTQNPYTGTNKAYKKQAKAYSKILASHHFKDSLSIIEHSNWVGTTNFNMRKPNIVVIHHTAQNSCDQTLKTFTLPRTQVSAHYVICKDGTIHHMLNDYLRAWHAGVGSWGNINDVNSSSIGIELDNNGSEPFPEAQIQALERVLAHLKKSYNIPKANFIGHADIAPTRKNDPNISFDWKTLASKGFGNWFADTTNVIVPQDFKPMHSLKMIGYSIKDSSACVTTFKRKFLKTEDQKPLNLAEEKVLYAVFLESMKF